MRASMQFLGAVSALMREARRALHSGGASSTKRIAGRSPINAAFRSNVSAPRSSTRTVSTQIRDIKQAPDP